MGEGVGGEVEEIEFDVRGTRAGGNEERLVSDGSGRWT
jgi:hypothetical protein